MKLKALSKDIIVQVPVVGSKIVITTSYSHGAAMIPPQPTEKVYEGTVVAPFKWLNDREFCLTGTKDFPIRVINISSVIDIKVLKGKLKTIVTDNKVWNVKGSKGNTYTVTRNSSKWDCTCPGFTFRKTCKHVSELSSNKK